MGKGRLLFPTPENILLFYRHCFDMVGLGMYVDVHYRYVVIFNFADPLKIFLDGSIVEVKQGEGTFILPYQYHRFINEGQKDLSLAFVTCEMQQNIYFEHMRNSVFSYGEKELDLLARLAEAFCKNHYRPLPYLMGLLLSQIASSHETIPPELYEKAHRESLISKILQTVYDNKSVLICQLARDLGYSESYLRAYFKKKMNLPLGRFIIEIRLTEAMRLLSESDRQISEIAELCGYENIYSFSRSFKKHVRITPSQFRYRIQVLQEEGEQYRLRSGIVDRID